tara:strand:+ start:4000 stop:4521 length:522 start_codon:yes stop_codon:yes gene_type:complete
MIELSTLKSLFLLFLVVSGNFIGGLLGCQAQKLLTNNIYAKHFVLLSLIYFTIDLTSDETLHPNILFKKTIQLWVFYILFSNIDINFTIIIVILLIVLYVSDDYYTYFKNHSEKKEESKELIQKLEIIINTLGYIIVTFLIIGFIIYFLKQKREKKNNFHFMKFLLGTVKCKN